MTKPQHSTIHLLTRLIVLYLLTSLLHFIHNAEFIEIYPGLPAFWTRFGVYLAWAALTVVGLSGWILTKRGHAFIGLSLVAFYALLGMDSLGHYVAAPMSAHSPMMNLTILLEVFAATLVFIEAIRLIVKQASEAKQINRSPHC